MATKIRLSNITQPLDQDLSVPNLTASGNIASPYFNATNIATGYQLNGTTVLNYSGGNVVLGDLGAGVKLEFNGSNKLITSNTGISVTGDVDASGTISSDGLVSSDNVLITGGSLQVRNGIPFYLWNSDTTNWMHLRNIGTANTAGDARLSFTGQGIGEVAYITNSGDMGIDGSLVVGGDFTVSGNTTFINSDNLAIEDLNIVLANGAADSTAANGAGITVDGANAQITYDGTNDLWQFNKGVRTDAGVTIASAAPSLVLSNTAVTYFHRIRLNASNSLIVERFDGTSTPITLKLDETGDVGFYENNGGTPQVGMHWDYADGRLGIGDTTPDYLLDLYGNPGTSAGALLRLNSSQTDDNGIIHEQADGTKWFTGPETSNPNDYEFWHYNGSAWSNILHVGADGTIGIGTDTPGQTLHLKSGGSTTYMQMTAGTLNGYIGQQDDGEMRLVTAGGSTFMTFQTEGLQRMIIDSAGNAGIRATSPQAHYTGYTALDIGASGSLFSNRTTSDTNVTMLTNNAYLNSDASAWTYIHNDEATRYTQANGKHLFYNAVASTGAITWKEALVIDGSNRLGANVSNPSAAIHTYTSAASAYNSTAVATANMSGIKVTASPNESVMTGIWFGTGGNATGSHWTGIAGSRVDHTATWGTRLSFYTHDDSLTSIDNAYERLTIDPAGNVGIGTPAPSYQLHVKGAGDIKIEDDAGGSAHLRIAASTSGTRDSEWKVKVSGSLDEFHIDHDYTAGGVSVGETAFKLGSNHSIYNNNDQPTIAPTLSLDFTRGETLDPRVKFYRDSTATYYDKSGILRYATANVPRFDYDPATGKSKGLLIEEDKTNSLLYSYKLSRILTESSTSVQLIDEYGLAPDQTYSATLMYQPEWDTSGTLYVYNSSPGNPAGGTVSFYVKSNGASYFAFGNAAGKATLDFSTGTLDNYSNGGNYFNAEDVGNGWYRVWTVNTNAITLQNQIYISGTSSGGASSEVGINKGVLIWGMQVEDEKFPTSYIPSKINWNARNSSATYYDENGVLREAPFGTPRYGYKYNGRKWLPTGLIAEDASTNLFTTSGLNDPFNNGGNETTNVSGVPDVMGGNRTIEVTTGLSGYGLISGLPANSEYTYSVYAKSNGATYMGVYADASAITGFSFYWIPSTGEAYSSPSGSVLSYGSENVGNGWWRLWVVIGTDSDGGSIAPRVAHSGGAAYFCFPQFEAGRKPTSYIPTYGSAVTRVADSVSSVTQTRANEVAYMGGDDFDEVYNQSKGTLFFEASTIVDANYAHNGFTLTLSKEEHPIWHGGGQSLIGLGNNMGYGSSSGNASSLGWWVEDTAISGDEAFAATTALATKDVPFKMALAFETNDVAGFADGSQVGGTDTSVDIPIVNIPDMKTLIIGGGNGGRTANEPHHGHIRKVAYYPERLSNAQLQALTENN